MKILELIILIYENVKIIIIDVNFVAAVALSYE